MLASASIIVAFIALFVAVVCALRIVALLPHYRPHTWTKAKAVQPEGPVHILIVLGSGGHTAEMLALLRNLDYKRYSHRSYIVSSGDAFSAQKAQEFERQLQETPGTDIGAYDIAIVPRARKIHQSILTTPLSSILCLWACICILCKPAPPHQPSQYPHVIITNGPGTGVIVILASYILRLLRPRGTRGKMRTVYVESWARVRRLSLSGKILLPLVNRFIVQWKTLAEATGGRAEYIGVLV